MPPASNKPHSAGKYSGYASNLAHLGRMRLQTGRRAAARWQMMLLVESRTLPHRPWTTMSLENGRTRKRRAAGGWSEAEVCAEEVAAPRKPVAPSGSSSTTQSKAPSGSNSTAQSNAPSGRATCRTSSIATRNLPNQQHREEHFLSNNGAKWAGAEVVRGSNLACFLKNFVSNYIVIFLMMLFRVHL